MYFILLFKILGCAIFYLFIFKLFFSFCTDVLNWQKVTHVLNIVLHSTSWFFITHQSTDMDFFSDCSLICPHARDIIKTDEIPYKSCQRLFIWINFFHWQSFVIMHCCSLYTNVFSSKKSDFMSRTSFFSPAVHLIGEHSKLWPVAKPLSNIKASSGRNTKQINSSNKTAVSVNGT